MSGQGYGECMGESEGVYHIRGHVSATVAAAAIAAYEGQPVPDRLTLDRRYYRWVPWNGDYKMMLFPAKKGSPGAFAVTEVTVWL